MYLYSSRINSNIVRDPAGSTIAIYHCSIPCPSSETLKDREKGKDGYVYILDESEMKKGGVVSIYQKEY